jgi:Galactose-3-O-sulfotransferase
MLVFVHINKTAGSTVRYILRSSYGSRHCDVEPWHSARDDRPFSTQDLRRLRRIYPRLASIAGHRVTGHTELREQGTEFAYFTFLRDPLKLCASRFQYHIDHRKKTHLVFEEWIQQDWLRNAQTQRIAGTQNVDDAIRVIGEREMFVGLTERFDESMVLLKALRAGDLDIGYSPVNVARKSSIASTLLADDRSRKALVDANGADLALYEYVTRELYPGFERDFGDGLADAVAGYRRDRRQSFNRRKLTVSRVKRHGLYRPLLRLYRSRATGSALERLLDRPQRTDNPV